MIMIFVKMRKNMFVLMLVFLLVIPIIYSVSVTKEDIHLALQRASFISIENPSKSNLTDDEISDLYYFYLNSSGNSSAQQIDLILYHGKDSGVMIESIYLKAIVGYVDNETVGKNCDDGNLCTDDLFDYETFNCTYTFNTDSCDDGNPCTLGDMCGAGICHPGTGSLDCSDNNPCTTESCLAGVGCRYSDETDGTSCDDGLWWTAPGTSSCDQGECVSNAYSCQTDDNNICTDEEPPGCVSTPNNNRVCNDGLNYTINDVCSNGDCSGTNITCQESGDQCKENVIDVDFGVCTLVNLDGNTCTDYNSNTENDTCSNGVCVGIPLEVCTPESYYSCHQDDVYWFDSCNVLGSMKQECYVNYTENWGDHFCKDGNVYRNRTLHDRGCSVDSCYDNLTYEEESVEDCEDRGCYAGVCGAGECSDCGNSCSLEECHSLGDCYYSSGNLFTNNCVDMSLVLNANLTCYDINFYECENNISGLNCGWDGGRCENGCSDGTKHGDCSYDGSRVLNPMKCTNGTLADECIFCGCPYGYDCYQGSCVTPGSYSLTCGNGECEGNENINNCPADCIGFPMNENALCVYNLNSAVSKEICEYYNETRYRYSEEQVLAGNYPYPQEIKLFGLDIPDNVFMDDYYEDMSLTNFQQYVLSPLIEYVDETPNITHLAIAKDIPTTVYDPNTESAYIADRYRSVQDYITYPTYDVDTIQDTRRSYHYPNTIGSTMQHFNPEDFKNETTGEYRDRFAVSYLTGYNLEEIKSMIDRAIAPAPDFSESLFLIDSDTDNFPIRIIDGFSDRYIVFNGINPDNIVLESTNIAPIMLNKPIFYAVTGGVHHFGYGKFWITDGKMIFNTTNRSFMTSIESFNAHTFTGGPGEQHREDLGGVQGHIADTFTKNAFMGEDYSGSFSSAVGHVHEPGLGGTLRTDVFITGYLSGLTLAESVLYANPPRRWMIIAVGDPLMRIIDGKRSGDLGNGEFCEQDSDCFSGNCDNYINVSHANNYYLSEKKLCHGTDQSCPRYQNLYGNDPDWYETLSGNRFCLNDTTELECKNGIWEEPEEVEYLNKSCSNTNLITWYANTSWLLIDGQECNTDQDCSGRYCTPDFEGVKRCHNYPNGCIIGDNGYTVPNQNSYCKNETHKMKCEETIWQEDQLEYCQNGCQNGICIGSYFEEPNIFNLESDITYTITSPIKLINDLENSITADTDTFRLSFYVFRNGAWDSYTYSQSALRGKRFSPSDLTLSTGEGITVRPDRDISITLNGEMFGEQDSIKIQGEFNLIGVPFCNNIYTAKTLLEEIKNEAPECYKVQLPTQNSMPPIWWSDDNSLTDEGEKKNFNITHYDAYWLYCDDNTNIQWTPGCEADDSVCNDNGVCEDGETVVNCANDCYVDLPAGMDMRDKTLIIYNSNSLDALEIAEYYADKRGIARERVCEVRLPTGQYAHVDYLLGARKDIIENCICESIPIADRPSPCDDSNLDAISEVSQISHVAIIKGIPVRLYGTTWDPRGASIGDEEEPSFDFFLINSLYRNTEFDNPAYIKNEIVNPYNLYDKVTPWQFYAKPINISSDKDIAYGRVEAINKERTIELIDKTIAAERSGFVGNVLQGGGFNTQTTNIDQEFRFLQELTSSNKPICEDYAKEAPYGLWDNNSCRFGTTANGHIPGEFSSIPNPLYAGIYSGRDADKNGHAGFDGFSNMLNWHKSQNNCVELCKYFSDPIDEQNCRDNSTDYFKEINTDCVGVASGFMGHQYRSYPVQYYGFMPPKWNVIQTAHGYGGQAEKTPPTIMSGSSYKDSYFTDDKYLRYGSLNSLENPSCVLEDGSTESCYEKIGIMLYKDNPITSLYIYDGEVKNFKFKMRYRSSPNINQGKIKVDLKFFIKNDGVADQTVSKYMSIEPNRADWETKELTFPISYINNNEGYVEINKVQLHLMSKIRDDGIIDWLEIDGLELINEESSENILDINVGSFNATQTANTHSGDYAANVIDRLGGIGWWGSSSHFDGMGGSPSNGLGIFSALFSGRTIGESIAYTSKTGFIASIIYVDPLYRPSGVKIYTENNSIPLKPERLEGPGYRFSLNNGPPFDSIFINAFHGQNNLDSTNWELSYCTKHKRRCDVDNSWIVFESGTNAVYEHEIKINLEDFIENIYLNQNISIRLEVWNTGERWWGLKDYADLYYDYLMGDPEQLCNVDSDCPLGNCDEDRNGIKRCHPNKSSCVNGKYDNISFETENGQNYCFSDMSTRKCIDSVWQEPEHCKLGCLTNGECEPKSNGRLCQIDSDCDLVNAEGYFYCDEDFFGTKRCHSFENGCIYNETGDEVSINEQYCIDSKSLVRCMGNNAWSEIINCEGSCSNDACVKENYANYTFILDQGYVKYLLSLPINTSSAKINTIFNNGFKSGWFYSSSDQIYIWNNTKQNMEMIYNFGILKFPFAEWNQKWIKSYTDSSPSTAEIKLGEGFEIKKTDDLPRTIIIHGETINKPVSVNIVGNKSLIGIPFCHNNYDASKVINEINGLDESCKNITKWDSQQQTTKTIRVRYDSTSILI